MYSQRNYQNTKTKHNEAKWITNIKIPLTELLTLSAAILLTELGHVLQYSHSMEGSCLHHLTDLLPGVAGGVVLQDVTQKDEI